MVSYKFCIGKTLVKKKFSHVFDEPCQLEQSWWSVTKGKFLPSFIEISPIVSDKQIFKKINPVCFENNNVPQNYWLNGKQCRP